MTGIVLAGETGSGLFPLTRITNKHLLPLGPMITCPFQPLVDAGVRIKSVPAGRTPCDFLRLLANASDVVVANLDHTCAPNSDATSQSFGPSEADLKGAVAEVLQQRCI